MARVKVFVGFRFFCCWFSKQFDTDTFFNEQIFIQIFDTSIAIISRAHLYRHISENGISQVSQVYWIWRAKLFPSQSFSTQPWSMELTSRESYGHAYPNVRMQYAIMKIYTTMVYDVRSTDLCANLNLVIDHL